MLNTLIALLFLSIIIMVHELGHFLTGKLVGIYAEEFSIGMGPRLFKYEGRETVYSIRAFPIGGYVKFLGEDADDSDPRAFNNAPIWKRFIVIAAGALMNFLFAIALLSILFSTHGIYIPAPIIEEVSADSPAQIAGLEAGDRIVAIENLDIEEEDGEQAIETIIATVEKYGSNEIDMKILREGQYHEIIITPRYDQERDVYLMGVLFGYDLKELDIGRSIPMAISQIGKAGVMMLRMVGNLIFKRQGLDQITGPIGIVGEIGRAAKAGATHLVELGVIISLNLGIINLIPFPALDGGRLLLLIIEAVRRKPMDRDKEGFINLIGFALLLLLMIIVTFKDIKG